MKKPHAVPRLRRTALNLALLFLLTFAPSAFHSLQAQTAPTLRIENYSVNNQTNGVLAINACNPLRVTLRNSGTTRIDGISTTLATSTPGVRITQSKSNYPALGPNATAANTTLFQVSTAANLACGSRVALGLKITTSTGSRTLHVYLTVGTVFNAAYESSDVPKEIPDGTRLTPGTATSELQVSGFTGSVSNVTASLYLTHTYLSDLVVTLIGPDGTAITLSDRSGDDGEDFGTSSTRRTVFDDAATPTLFDDVAPYVGRFEPDQPLQAFAGKSGAAINGKWRLQVQDTAGGDIGTLNNWGITLQRVTCQNGGGSCGTTEAPSLVVTTKADTIDSNDGLTSLREAILYANAKANTNGPDRITFKLGGNAPYSINVGAVSITPLPAITQPVIIDGRSQPGFVDKPIVVLNGNVTRRGV
ncbi:MAG TPA: proprotein convertase P-domain-containing protein, partial [Abditibacteriaceae bacterium]